MSTYIHIRWTLDLKRSHSVFYITWELTDEVSLKFIEICDLFLKAPFRSIRIKTIKSSNPTQVAELIGEYNGSRLKLVIKGIIPT